MFDWRIRIIGCKRANCITTRPTGKFSVLRFKGKQLQCAECVNSPVDFIAAKALIINGWNIDLELASSTEVKLKDCIS